MWVERAPWGAGVVGELECHCPGWGDPAVPRPGQADSPLCSWPIFCCQLEPGVFLQIVRIRVNQRFPVPGGYFPPVGLRGHLQELSAGYRLLRKDLE